MVLLLASFDQNVPGMTVNRLCGSDMDAINLAAQSIKSGETQLVIVDGTDSMLETGENVASRFNVSRFDQDLFAHNNQQKYAAAAAKGLFNAEIIPVEIVHKKWAIVLSADEHPGQTTLEALGRLPTPFRKDGTVTAGNASGVNDGSAALLRVPV